MLPNSGRSNSSTDRANNNPERKDLRHELDLFEAQLKELKVQFEQFFTGLLPLPPDKLQAQVKHAIRVLRKAPFKNSAINYRLRMLETRYSTLNTYWQRVLKEREEGTYSKDVFKANLRERIAAEEAEAQTTQGLAEKSLHSLFNAYRTALEKQHGKAPQLEFDSFRDSLVRRAKEFKAQHADKKLSFKVVVKQGKVVVQAKVRE